MSSVVFIVLAYTNTNSNFWEFLKNPIVYAAIWFINVTIELILFFSKRTYKTDVLVSVKANILFIFVCSIMGVVYIFFLWNYILN